jgi:hypothetical protein
VSDKDEPDIIEHLNVGLGLRLIKTPEPKRPAADPRLKAILEDLQRPRRVQREAGRDPGSKDAA